MNVTLLNSQTLNKMAVGDRQTILLPYLQEQIANFIGVDAADLEAEMSLQYLGIDSLIAVRLRNQLRTDLLVEISAVDLMTETTVGDLSQMIAQLLDYSREKSLTVAEYQESKSYPLTYGQQGLWFLYQLAPESSAYNLAFTAHICSKLDILALQRAVQKLVERHGSLRTKFRQDEAEPFQEVCPAQSIKINQINASSWQENELKAKVRATHKIPFVLETGSLLRVHLFIRSEEDYYLLIGIHHIAIDGFSFGILLDELRLLYQSETTEQVISLPTIERQYGSFVQWQQEMLQSPIGKTHRDYWHQKLSGELPLLKLPVANWESGDRLTDRAYYEFELDSHLEKQLREMAKTEGVTLYMLMLTTFKVLLHRYTGQEDIIVGSPSEGRSQSQFSQTIGFFINMIALRSEVKGKLTFSELLSQVRQTVLKALTHQDYPSTLIIESLQLNKDATLSGLFQVVFNLLKLSDLGADYELSMSAKAKKREDWGGLSLEPFVIPQQEGQYDQGQYNLGLDIVETKESIFGIFRYDADLFDQAAIERMSNHFKNLLGAIVIDSKCSIGQLSMLDKPEKQQLATWNQNLQNFNYSDCIHQLFEAQVELTPDAIAVSFQEDSLTYRELNNRANQLAHYLQGKEVGAEVLVGICLDRSLEMILCVLGVLKAGGAYLPLDPTYPKERLSFILADAQISVLLTQEKLVEELPSPNVAFVFLDQVQESLEKRSQDNLAGSVIPENLAYTIYTSGSTGQAKGVQVTHLNLVNAYQGWEKAYKLKTLKSHLQMASFSFDVFSGDWIRALCSGAHLVLCPKNLLLEPAKLYQLMFQSGIDSAEFVPAVLKNLVQYLQDTKQNLHFMKLLVVGSDILYVREFEQFKSICGNNTRLINSYGVTEATIDSTYFEYTTLKLPKESVIPIGRPFGNIEIQILDRQLQPLAIGIPGDLYLSGYGISRGYLNRSDLTQERFMINPADSSHKLYQTGDLARYLPDGNIEFLGRIDNQVKVRGFRIEVGEIEAALVSQPQIVEAVVNVREEKLGNRYLAAYIVAKSQTITGKELREFLQHKLPSYMVPNAFVFLDAIPLSPNGKVDCRSLPIPDLTCQSQQTYVAPRNLNETEIAKIFASVLEVEQVGIFDSFFELGGHSLLATQIISRLRQAFKLDFPLRDFLEFPTVAGLAQKVMVNLLQRTQPNSGNKNITSSPCLVPIKTFGTQLNLFCIHPVGGQVVAYQKLANYLGLSVYGLQSQALLDHRQEHPSIESMASEYARAIRQQANGPYYLMGWSMGGVIALSIAQQLLKQKEEVAFLGLLDSYLLTGNTAALNYDPLQEFLPLLGDKLAQALAKCDESEQQRLCQSLIKLTSRDRLRKILAWGKAKGFLAQNVSFKVLQQQLSLMEIHQQLLGNHIPPTVDTKLHLWHAAERIIDVAPTDWQKYTTGEIYRKVLPGNHFSLVNSPQVEILAQDLQACFRNL